MGYWKFIVPEATTNLFDDPSFALADPDTEWNFSGDGAAPDWTRDTTYSFFGFSCALADVDAGGGGTLTTIYQTLTTTATDYTLSAYVRRSAGGTVSNSQCVAWFDDGAHNWDSITHVGNNWYYCVYTGTATAAANAFGVRALEDGLYVDAVQLENKGYATTYCDGEQEGCTWDLQEYTSNSTRSAQSRAGGRVYDFEDDYSFEVVDWQGWGVPQHLLNLDRYAVLPGAQVNSIKIDVTTLTLTGYFQGTTLANLHALRQALVEELAHDRYPQTADGWQPIRIRYTGATVHKEARCYYDSGLEGSSMVGNAYTERMPVRLLMMDPFWYSLGESAAILDTNDNATLRRVAGRLRTTGQWDDLGLTANPTTASTLDAVQYNPHDGRIYLGGNFTNWDGDAAIDYFVAYDPSLDSWIQLGGGGAVNGRVRDLAIAPNGDVYLCGDFTNLGDANGDYVARYRPSADTYHSLAAQAGGSITEVRSLCFDHDGLLYVCGDFTNWNGIGNADDIFSWDGSAYAAVGTGVTSSIFGAEHVRVGLDNTLFMGGSFDEVGGTTAYYVAQWDGSSWSAMGDGFNSTVRAVAIDSNNGTLYACGSFTTNHAATETYNRVARWSGAEWEALGDGVDSTCYSIKVGPDGLVYVGGNFTEAGGISVAEGIARWNGTAWAHLDVKVPAAATGVEAIETCRQDPVVAQNYDIYITCNGSGTGYFAGSATVTNNGTAAQYPVLVVSRSGGTTATLMTLRNETTGRVLLFDYALLNGETLTVDCRPGKKSVTSSMFGPRSDAILAASDFGSFTLQPGANQLTSYISVSGAPTIMSYVLWKDIYRGMD